MLVQFRALVADNPFLVLALHRLRRRAGRVVAELAMFVGLLGLATFLPIMLVEETSFGFGLDRGAVALAVLTWVHLLLLWIVTPRGESFADDATRQRLEFIKLAPQTPLGWVAGRAVFPALRAGWLVLHAAPFYLVGWMLGGASARALVVYLVLLALFGLRVGITRLPGPMNLIWLVQVVRFGGGGFGAVQARTLLLLPFVVSDWLAAWQPWFALRLWPLPFVIAWCLWGTYNSAVNATSWLTPSGNAEFPPWLPRARSYVGTALLLLVVGFAWRHLVNGYLPSLTLVTGAPPADALGGLLVLWLLLIKLPFHSPPAAEAENEEEDEDAFAEPQPVVRPPAPEGGWVRDTGRLWLAIFGYAWALFGVVSLLGWTFPLRADLVGRLVVISFVAVAVVQGRRWRGWLTTGLRLPFPIGPLSGLWFVARALAMLLALVEPAGLPRALAVLSPVVALFAQSPFADDWDARFTWLQLPTATPLWLIALVPLIAEVVESAGALLGARWGRPIEVTPWTPEPAPDIAWHQWERRLLERWDNAVFAFHYARWRRGAPQLPARWMKRVAAAVVIVPLVLSPWLTPLWPLLRSSIGELRTALAAVAMLGLFACVLFSMSPVGFVGDRLWRERASGSFENLLLVPMTERELVLGWLAAGVTGVLPSLAPVALVTVLAVMIAWPFPTFPLALIGGVLTLPVLAALALIIDASTAWVAKEVNFAAQSHAGGVLQTGAVIGLVFAVLGLASLTLYIVIIVVCLLAWLSLPIGVWRLTAQLRKLRRRWGETYAARAP